MVVRQTLANFCKLSYIYGNPHVEASQLQPASIDLRIGKVVHQVRSSFLPGQNIIHSRLRTLKLQTFEDITAGIVLHPGSVYIAELVEHLDLPPEISGRTNPKSSIGRIDVFARVICDKTTKFDIIPAGYKGPLFLEISPKSFPIIVRPGDRLSQLRLYTGDPLLRDEALRTRIDDVVPRNSLDHHMKVIDSGLLFSVSLHGRTSSSIIGYRAKANTPPIDLGLEQHYDHNTYWEPIRSSKGSGLILQPGDFYLFATRERVIIPPDLSAELIAYDTDFGEFRSHYAGFFDSGFGLCQNRPLGAHIVVEMRVHDVPFFLQDGQVMFRMVFFNNSEMPDILYGESLCSHYQGQKLKLSKYFRYKKEDERASIILQSEQLFML